MQFLNIWVIISLRILIIILLNYYCGTSLQILESEKTIFFLQEQTMSDNINNFKIIKNLILNILYL